MDCSLPGSSIHGIFQASIPEEEPTEKKPYMPEEKAKDLMEKHPEMRAFVADLGLDTK